MLTPSPVSSSQSIHKTLDTSHISSAISTLLQQIMAVFIKAKRVSEPLDERVKARLLSHYATSSGSEHEEAGSSCALSGLVHAFLDLDESVTSATMADAKASCECCDNKDLSLTHVAEMVKGLLRHGSNLHSIVAEAAGAVSKCDRRAVMTQLRDKGYNAGICKAKWEKSGGMTAGSYEYIDIIVHDDERYIVDLDFRVQFEVARATTEYEKLVATLPSVMVGKAEDVRQVVKAMAEAASRSLKSKGLSVPPWRKRRYVVNKWFGNYRRTINSLPSGGSVIGIAGRGEIIKCRAVGFGAENLRGGELRV